MRMMDIEQRIFELLGEDRDAPDIIDTVAAEYGVERNKVKEMCLRVIRERGTPRLARVRAAIDRLERIRFV
jgi:hypothetical protein